MQCSAMQCSAVQCVTLLWSAVQRWIVISRRRLTCENCGAAPWAAAGASSLSLDKLIHSCFVFLNFAVPYFVFKNFSVSYFVPSHFSFTGFVSTNFSISCFVFINFSASYFVPTHFSFPSFFLISLYPILPLQARPNPDLP